MFQNFVYFLFGLYARATDAFSYLWFATSYHGKRSQLSTLLRAMNHSGSSVICRTDITDEELVALSQFDCVRDLDLNGCRRITDAGLKHVARMPNVELVNLINCTSITDDGIQYLKDHMPKLRHVEYVISLPSHLR